MIQFDPTKHVYSKDGTVYTSVTTLIKQYCTPFDGEFMGTYKAVKDVLLQYEGESYWSKYKKMCGERMAIYPGWKAVVPYFRENSHPREIEILARKEWYIQEWTKIGRIASERGTRIHEDREKEIKGKEHVVRTIQGNTVILQVSQDTILPMQDFHQDKIYTEIILCNDEFKVAGMVDVAEKHQKVVHLSDYKTYKEITYEGFDNAMMKPPLQMVPDCKYQMAQLQMSLYAYMFECVGYNPGSLTMIHLTGEDGKEEKRYPMLYKRDLVIAMLKDFKDKHSF